MGFGHRRNWGRDSGYWKKRNVRLIVAIIGSVVMVTGFGFLVYGTYFKKNLESLILYYCFLFSFKIKPCY